MNLAICQALLASAALLAVSAAPSPDQRLLLISLDGFRWDLLNKTMAPTITAWAEKSSWFVHGSQSQYISYTAPNHMSISTGVYEETHGIVSNFFFDEETQQHFDVWNFTERAGVLNASLEEHWYRSEPIWLANDRNGGRSALYYWPMGDASFPGTPKKASFYKTWIDHGNLSTWKVDAKEIVDRLTTGQTNFLAWYVSEPDHTLHQNGFFFANALQKKLAELDELFGFLLHELEAKGLLASTNIILTADHGHAEVIDPEHIMCVRDFVAGVPHVDYQVGDHMIYPNDQMHAEQVYNNLTAGIKEHKYDVKVMWRKDLPDSTHYGGDHKRVGQIVLEPAIGSLVNFNCTLSWQQERFGAKLDQKEKLHSSTHGQDPNAPEMRAILVMGGPAFHSGITIGEVPQNIDLYGLMANLLGFPAAPNNGTLSIVSKALKHAPETTTMIAPMAADSLSALYFVLPAVLVVGFFFCYAWRRTVIMEDPTWSAPSGNPYKVLSSGEFDDEIDAPGSVEIKNSAFVDRTSRLSGAPRGSSGLLSLSSSDDEM